MPIEKIQVAAGKLHRAIREVTGPPRMPANDAILYEAIEAIIDAVINELVIEWRKADE